MSEFAKKDNSAERWLFVEALKIRGLLFTIIALAFCIATFVVLQAHTLAVACQRVVIDRCGIFSISSLIITLFFLAIGRTLCTYFMESRSSAAAACVKASIRNRLYHKVQLLGSVGFSLEEPGSLIETVTKGVDELEHYFTRFLPQLVLSAILPLVFLIIILPSEWRSAAVLLFSAPFIPLFMILIGKGSEKLHRQQWSYLSKMAGYLLDLVQGLPDLIIFGAAKREAEALGKISDKYRQATMTVLRVAFLSAFTLEFFATVGTALVAVIIGFRLLSGSLSLVDGLFVLLMTPEFYLPFRNLGLAYHARMQGVAAAEKIAPILNIKTPDGYAGTILSKSIPPNIRFEGVSFRYGGNRGGVKDVNLELNSGSITALAGISGAGKTTLARLLVGLARPESGRILVNGEDLRELDPKSWRSQISWVSQTPYFFSGTVRENLTLGKPDATQLEIDIALKAAAATQFISCLSKGLDTVLGERGAGLSGGELKRLALARAYLSKTNLIVLDEPTAGLDLENEKLVCDAISNLLVGRTVLLITHREQTLLLADKVVEMIDGQIDRIVTPDVFLMPHESMI